MRTEEEEEEEEIEAAVDRLAAVTGKSGKRGTDE